MPGTPSTHPARHIFSWVGLTVFSLLIVGSFAAAFFYATSALQSGQLAAVISATLVDLTNEDRRVEDLGTLKISPVLTAAAQAKANDMAAKGYFAHVSPEGLDSWHWFTEAGYAFSAAGENLAVNFSDSEKVEAAWMDSPTHRKNILNGKFTEIGIATAVGEYKGKKTTFVVQMFGTPRALGATAVVPAVPVEAPEVIAISESETTVLGSESEEAPAAASIETNAPAAPASVEEAPRYASPLDAVAVSPETPLQLFYLLSALVVVIALALITEFEFKRHHFRHMAAAGFLLVLIGSLAIVADQMIFTDPIITEIIPSSISG